MCRGCLEELAGECVSCGADSPRGDIAHKDLDSDDNGSEGASTLDVRAHPPRFTPAARRVAKLPKHLWREQRGWFHWKDEIKTTGGPTCSGCDKRCPKIRALVTVVLHTPEKSERYQHKLCGRCMGWVVRHESFVQLATCGDDINCVVIEARDATKRRTD